MKRSFNQESQANGNEDKRNAMTNRAKIVAPIKKSEFLSTKQYLHQYKLWGYTHISKSNLTIITEKYFRMNTNASCYVSN